MLTSLRIENIVLVDRVTIAFRPGFCALTGETGAGKSILPDSLSLALGARADSGLVRRGAAEGSVTASFEVKGGHPVFRILEEAGLHIEPGEPLILRRNLKSDGGSRAFVNDQPVSAGLLRQAGSLLVEIHGQFDTQGLLDPGTHRELLDDYAGVDLSDLESRWSAWQAAREAVETLKEQTHKARAEEEYLCAAVADLDRLSPEAGEEERLAGLRERLMHRERVLEGLNAAYHRLNGEDDPIRTAMGALDRIALHAGEGVESALAALERANAEIQEALAVIESLSSDLVETEHSLESIDDRLFALRAQARKHHCSVDELPAMRKMLAESLNAIEHGDEMLGEKIWLAEQAERDYRAESQKISAARKTAAEKLDRLVQKELPPLKLEKAQFLTEIIELPPENWGPGGGDQVRFLVATNPGAEAGPLHKIASGGEMSRFMLALKAVMAETGSAGTLIFDEVDSGIGGRVADAVGERLARLATARQILVVTHAPQVAARASHHWIVLKEGKDEVTTKVIPLSELPQRREEIARMLSGAEITEEARAAADRLLETGT